MKGFSQWLKRSASLLIENIKRPHSFINKQIRKLRLIGGGFVDDKCLLRASALSFSTILSIVPLFAAVLLVLKGFGSGSETDIIIQRVEEFVQQLLPQDIVFSELAEGESVAHIIAIKFYEFSERLSASRVGGIGVIFLIVTAISLLITIEGSMNDIWGVKKRRSFFNRLVVYWGLLTLTPVLILPALSTSFAAHSKYLVEWMVSIIPSVWVAGLVKSHFIPIIFMTFAFTLFFMIIPSTRVRFRSALSGGFISALLFALAVTSFGSVMALTGKVQGFKIVYGVLALVPLLLTFIYVSWVIILFGSEVAFADQNASTYYLEQETANANISSKERLALRLVGEITKGFTIGGNIPSASELHDRLMLPIRVINEILDMLDKAGILVGIGDHEMTYHPARALDIITVNDVLNAVRKYGKDLELPQDEIGINIDAVMQNLERSGSEIGSVTVDKLVRSNFVR